MSVGGFSSCLAEAGQDHSNLFLNCSTSLARAAECAVDVATCITPGHSIYSTFLGRYLLPEELLAAQAIFRRDATDPANFDRLLEEKSVDTHTSLAQDLAGNGMTGTVAQAVVLSALASSTSWDRLQPDEMEIDQAPSLPKPPVCTEHSLNHSDKRGQKRTLSESLVPQQEDEAPWIPPRRVRGKTKPQDLLCRVGLPKKRRNGKGAGNKRAKGKSKMVTIAEKEAIFEALEKAKKSGTKNPYKTLESMPGYFKSCTAPSKWGLIREEQKWPVLVKSAPQICKRFKELPNSIRRVLSFTKLKHGDAHTKSDKQRCLPFELKEVIEGLVMDRIEVGEEVTLQYVKGTILFCIDLWNENVLTMRKLMEERSVEIVQQHDHQISTMNSDEIDNLFDNLHERAQEVLQPVNMVETDGALLQLVLEIRRYDPYEASRYIGSKCNAVQRLHC